MLPEVNTCFELIQDRFQQLQDLVEEAGSDPALLNWSPDEEQPTLFGVAAFAALNAEYWIGHVIGGRSEPAGFDSVLEVKEGGTPEILAQLIADALENSRKVLEPLDETRLNSPLDYADEIFTAWQCLLQVLDEAAARYGEAQALVRWYHLNEEGL